MSLDPRWLKRRQQLNDRFAAVQRIRDASQLAYMRGPARRFTEEEVQRMWAEVASDPMPGTLPPRNHVYMHVPFCKSICAFCNYERLKPSHPDLMKGWLQRVLRSLDTLGPALKPLTFHSLYIGGGTPSTLPAAMLDEVLGAVFDTLSFAEGSGRHIELDPAVVSQTRLDVLQKYGFTRYSFGVQSLSAENNEAHNRGSQGKAIVDGCFDALHDRGWDRVTCDFLIGLWGTTPEQILADLAYVLEHHQPMSIDIFALIPTQSYVDQFFDGDTQAFWRHMQPFQELVPKTLPGLAAQHGYRLMEEGGHRYTLYRPMSKEGAVKYSYTQLVSEQQLPLNLLGLGTSARSQIFQKAAFQYRDPGEDPSSEGPAYYEGHELSPEEERRTYLIHQLRDRGYVERDRFEALFGLSLDQAVGVPLQALASQGRAELAADKVTLPDADGPDRARSLLWLVPDAAVEYEIARIQGMNLSSDGVAEVYRDLPIGTPMAPGYRWWGVREGRPTLKGDDGHKITLRLAPPLKDGGALRVVLETPPPPDRVPALSTAVKKLKALAARTLRPRSVRPD